MVSFILFLFSFFFISNFINYELLIWLYYRKIRKLQQLQLPFNACMIENQLHFILYILIKENY